MQLLIRKGTYEHYVNPTPFICRSDNTRYRWWLEHPVDYKRHSRFSDPMDWKETVPDHEVLFDVGVYQWQ